MNWTNLGLMELQRDQVLLRTGSKDSHRPPSAIDSVIPDMDTCSGLNLLNDRSDETLCLTSGPLLSVN